MLFVSLSVSQSSRVAQNLVYFLIKSFVNYLNFGSQSPSPSTTPPLDVVCHRSYVG